MHLPLANWAGKNNLEDNKDAVARGWNCLASPVSEHVQQAGVKISS